MPALFKHIFSIFFATPIFTRITAFLTSYSLEVLASNDPERCAGSSIATGRASMPERSKVRSKSKKKPAISPGYRGLRWTGKHPVQKKYFLPTSVKEKIYLYFHEYNYTKSVRQRKSGSEI